MLRTNTTALLLQPLKISINSTAVYKVAPSSFHMGYITFAHDRFHGVYRHAYIICRLLDSEPAVFVHSHTNEVRIAYPHCTFLIACHSIRKPSVTEMLIYLLENKLVMI